MAFIDFFLIAFFIGIFVCVRKVKNNQVIFGENDTTSLRGVMCILIVLHHFSEKNLGGFFFPYLQHLGYLIVSIFFFLSGFGVMSSYIKRGENYFKGFLIAKPLYLFIIYLLFCVPYTIIKFLSGIKVSILYFLLSFINGQTYVTFGWYIFVQIIYYLLFYTIFRFTVNKKVAIGLLCLFGIFVTIIFQLLKYDSYWYISNLSFPIGVIFASEKTKINFFIKKNYLVAILLTAIGFIVISYSYKLFEDNIFYVTTKNIATILFSVLVYCLFFKFTVKSKIWNFLGKISLEIYLWQGFFITLYSNYLKDYPIFWISATILSTVFIAYFSNLFNKKISILLKKVSS